jgi:small-conductance mechanosensitive channel
MDTPENYSLLLSGALLDWTVALGVATLVLLGFSLGQRLLLRRMAQRAVRSYARIDDVLLELVKATRLPVVAVVALYLGGQYLDLSAGAGKVLNAAATVALFVQAGLWGAALLAFWLNRSRTSALASNASAATSLAVLGFSGQLVLWVMVTLLALDNLGVNVTALVAGLGVGGIAVALAVQNILGDLFASLSIVIDKPFVIGDFIIVDSYMGTVEHVGLKTTRIRSLDGEQIVFSNSDLLKTRVRNYKRMYERRVLFKFAVNYDTAPDQLEKIPGLVRQIIEQQKKIRFERAHLQKLGDFSVDFEVVYWVLDPDYNLYMDIQQAINLALLRTLAKTGISLAYPTRSIQMDTPVRVVMAGLEMPAGRELVEKVPARGH